MNMVFVSSELATDKNVSGGLASFTANMARIFTQNGHKVTIVLSTVSEFNITFDENIRVVNSYVPLHTWERIDRLARILVWFNKHKYIELRKAVVNIYRSWDTNKKIQLLNKEEKIDIVHYCNLAALSFFASNKIPHVVRLSCISNLWRGAEEAAGKFGYKLYPLNYREKLEEYAIQRNKYVVSPSEYLAEITRNNINPEVTVIESPFLLGNSGWDYEVYNRKLKGKKYIIHYGRLGYLKGTHVICKLAKELLEKNPELYIVMAGTSSQIMNNSGNNANVEDVLRESAGEYADRIIYLGKLVREKLYPVIQKAEICVFPSRVENLANVCIEAMAMGKIVVATNGVSFEQMVDNKVTGFLCEAENAESFLEGITDALNLSEDDKLEMGTRAKKSVERMKPETIYTQYLEYYKQVIDKQRGK